MSDYLPLRNRISKTIINASFFKGCKLYITAKEEE